MYSELELSRMVIIHTCNVLLDDIMEHKAGSEFYDLTLEEQIFLDDIVEDIDCLITYYGFERIKDTLDKEEKEGLIRYFKKHMGVD